MDFEDISYYAGAAIASIGAGLYHLGAGLCCAGALIAFPAVLSILRSGPPQPPKGE